MALNTSIIGVITYATNPNTSNVVRNLGVSPNSLRILLETDAPYMIPSNIYRDLPKSTTGASGKLPLSHTAMIPWTAEWVANVVQETNKDSPSDPWTVERILDLGNQNAKKVYNI